MSEDFIILEGKNVSELIEIGLETINKTEDEVDVEILEKGRSLAGINIKKHKIKMSIKKGKIKVDETKKETTRTSASLKILDEEITQSEETSNSPIVSVKKPFEFLYKEEGVYLSIDTNCNLKPDLNEITEMIKIKEISGVEHEVIKDAALSRKDTLVKFAPFQEELLLDSRVEVEVTQDKTKGYIILHAPDGGAELSEDEILEKIEEVIKLGLDDQVVRSLVKEKKYGVKTLIAQGLKPVDGKNGYIDYKFEKDKENAPYIEEDGSVDFRNLNLISNVVRGDILATLHLPEPGEDGFNVLGEISNYKPGLEKTFSYGANITLSEDGTNLKSEIDGQVCVENQKIIVYEVYTIPKDVDNSTGNIEFNGNIKIQGNVLTGFKVEAKGNIEIDGSVEGATINCGGSLIIKRGIQGYNQAKIHSQGDILTKYIENAEVNSGGDIKSEAIMHSETVCEGSVLVGGKKGLLVGGTCRASHEISAKVIGSHMATATLLEVGLDPKIRENQEELIEMKKATDEDKNKFSKMITHLKKLDSEGMLDEEKKDMLNKSIVAKLQLEKKIITLKEEINLIDEKIKESSDGKIKVEETIFSGVRVIIGNSKMIIQEPRDHCTIYRDKEDYEIKVGPF